MNGVFDLAIHNYGKEKLIGSAHIEIPDALTAAWVDNLQRAITSKVLADTGIEMLGITIYAVNSSDTEAVGHAGIHSENRRGKPDDPGCARLLPGSGGQNDQLRR